MSSEPKDPKVFKKRPHRKVKSGCLKCKHRKIKCNEEKPQCSNCARYDAECIYPSPDILRDRTATPSATTPPLVRTPDSSMEDPPIPQYPSGSNEVPMRDLALMHHWCTATSYGFGDDFPGASDPWRVDIPIIAQHYPFLMRGILAITALHISRLTSDPSVRMKYIQLAAYNQDLALPEYRAAIGDVTEHNVAAVLAFSTFTSVYSFAAPKEPESLFSNSALEWIFLHRGVGEIPAHWQNWIDHGPLHAQMHRRRLPPVDPTFNAEDYRLLNLRNMFSILKPDEQCDIMHYESALYWMRQAFAHTFSLESKLSPKYAILYWVERIPNEYLELVSQKRPCAMVLFAHCCILFHRAANFWYLDGFAEHLLNEIITEVTPQYVPWMEWPIQTCGML